MPKCQMSEMRARGRNILRPALCLSLNTPPFLSAGIPFILANSRIVVWSSLLSGSASIPKMLS